MKVSIIGGGPGGLYFALLAQKAWPRWDITVYERNRPDDTFGFGVVFSDQTLDSFKAYDGPSYEMIRRRFAYWGDVDVVYKGRTMRSGGNGFCGCSRVALLHILHDRCRELGVKLVFQSEVEGLEEFAGFRPDRRRRRHQFEDPREAQGPLSSPASTCGRTSSPGWARPGRWMPSSTSSARRPRASSSRTATSTRRGAAPG